MTAAGATPITLVQPCTRSRVRAFALLAVFTLVLHVPFMAQPVRGDEGMYLDMARETLKHPLAPLDFRYVFQGREVDMLGHPHPPLNVYFIALLWLVRGQFAARFFHAGYMVFPLLAALAAYLLAEKFTPKPLWAALLVAASPLVQINTNTLASPEAPALAFLLIGAWLFLEERFVPAGLALSFAAFCGLQTLAVAPILLLVYWLRPRGDRNGADEAEPNQTVHPARGTAPSRPPRRTSVAALLPAPTGAWAAVVMPFVLLAGWQLFQFAVTGRFPLAVLFGYATGAEYGRPILKLTNALALVQHLGVLIVFLPLVRTRIAALAAGIPAGLLAALLAPGYPWWERSMLFLFVAAGVHALVWLWHARRDHPFLAAWCLAYFAFTLIAFFAGAARYLLPLAAPLVFLFVREVGARPVRLAAALAVSLFLGLNICHADYEFASVYAQVPRPPGTRFLINGEWGLRFYLGELGGRPLQRTSAPGVPGEWIVSSDLSLATNYDSLAEAAALPVRKLDLTVRSPLRLIDRYAHTGFSSATPPSAAQDRGFGLLPFSFSTRPLDRITYWRTSPFLYADAPWMPTQFSGRLVYVPQPGATVRLVLDPAWSTLRFVPFADRAGAFQFTVQFANQEHRVAHLGPGFGKANDIAISGEREVVLSIQSRAVSRAGWGELTAY